MRQTPSQFFRACPILAAVVICCLVIGYGFWPQRNANARRHVRAVLLKTAASTDEQITNLERFVRIGDHIDDVRHRLSPDPESEPKGVKRPTEWSLGLQGVNLEIAIESDGRVVGIGRHIYGTDDGPFWYVSPRWYHLVSGVN